MKYLIFIFLILFLHGCCEVETETHYLLNPEVILSMEIGGKVFRQLKEEYGLYLAECGWSMQGLPKIRGLHCGFYYYEEATIEKTRQMLLRVVELLLQEINAHTRLHPHLTHHPFTPECLQIDIFLRNPDLSPFEIGKLCVAGLFQNHLEYMTHHPETNHLTTILTETYKEATLKISEESLK